MLATHRAPICLALLAAPLLLEACSPRAVQPSAAPAAAPPSEGRKASELSAAEVFAEACLRSMDLGDFDFLWTNVDRSLKEAGVDRAKLEEIIRASRPIGSIPNRRRIASKRLTMLPRRARGEYVVVEWESAFPDAGTAIEMVVVSKSVDGRWLFTGSQISMAAPVE